MTKRKETITFLMVVATILFLSCTGRQSKAPIGEEGSIFDEKNLPAAEKLIREAMDLYDSSIILALTDSLEKTGDISATAASYYRGAAASNRGMLTTSEEHLRKATANSHPEAADLRAYLKARVLLSRILAAESDYEGALNEAVPTQAIMDSLGNKDFGDLTQLYIVIGECQQHLHMKTEAATSFAKAYTLLKEWMTADTLGKDMPRIILRLDNISTSFIHTSEYAKAKMWLDREDSALAIYVKRPCVIEKQSDFLRGTIQLDLATICQQLGQSEEAARHYEEHRKTIFSQRNVALINATDYLMRKMLANILAGRKDSAIVMGKKIAECFDSALTSQKQDAAAELATVYDTHGKEQQIAEQQMRLSRIRTLALVVAIITLTVFFAIFHITRQRAAKRLAKVNAAKERMENELNIARDIQMSMVPSTFPEVEGLDMYASMTPAKEVGGDLYCYLHKGDHLYFCVGDVSGKGVPASLFMAQTTRLFHTLASQGMNPAEICNIMNNELSGKDNEQGMFVTMFICRLNLKYKLLEYCNAGHNPPVLGNDDGQLSFLDMEPNAPIGLWPGLEYVGESIDFFKDRLLFLYTDGLNEAEDTEQKQFGDDRLLDILRQTQTESVRQIIETLTQEITRHRNGAEPNDDLTMMCIKL